MLARFQKMLDGVVFTLILGPVVSPALSSDGRMVAFVSGGNSFMSADQIYVKVLPNGEARRLTDDSRPKYELAFSPDGSEIVYTVMEPPGFSTYRVSVLGGAFRLFLKNVAGLTWLDFHTGSLHSPAVKITD